ncbi:O-antigen ligase family protein [Caenispirillum salinarum]|uniref:O-antigen ligase family protein n=1 Tax=Caenispirillum salinarum TaxID=859058 RepID=UPI00384C78B5
MGALRVIGHPGTLVAVFTIFIISGYLVRPTPTWAFPFYAIIVPLTLWMAWRERTQDWLRDKGLWLALAATTWFAASTLWSVETSAGLVGDALAGWAASSLFIVAGVAVFTHSSDAWRQRLLLGVPVAAMMNACISITRYLVEGADARLTGWAETRHPILGANVMIFAGLLALPLLNRDNTRRSIFLGIATVTLVSIFVYLTGSRGPLLTWSIALLVYACAIGSRLGVAAILSVGVAGACAALLLLQMPPVAELGLPGPLHDILSTAQQNLQRSSFRMEIWSIALERVSEQPILGLGIANGIAFSEQWSFPHSLYISALYYGGTIGLLLVVALLGSMAWRAFRARDSRQRALLLALVTLPAVAGLTDMSSIVRSPEENWLFFWMPLIMVLGLTRRPATPVNGAVDSPSCDSKASASNGKEF